MPLILAFALPKGSFELPRPARSHFSLTRTGSCVAATFAVPSHAPPYLYNPSRKLNRGGCVASQFEQQCRLSCLSPLLTCIKARTPQLDAPYLQIKPLHSRVRIFESFALHSSICLRQDHGYNSQKVSGIIGPMVLDLADWTCSLACIAFRCATYKFIHGACSLLLTYNIARGPACIYQVFSSDENTVKALCSPSPTPLRPRYQAFCQRISPP